MVSPKHPTSKWNIADWKSYVFSKCTFRSAYLVNSTWFYIVLLDCRREQVQKYHLFSNPWESQAPSSKWSLVFAFIEDRMWPVWDQEFNDLNHRSFKLTLWFWRFEGHSTAFQEPQSWIQPKRVILKQLGISLSSSHGSLYYHTNPNKTPSKAEIPQIWPYFFLLLLSPKKV